MWSTRNQTLWCLTFTWDQQVNHAASGHGTTFFFYRNKRLWTLVATRWSTDWYYKDYKHWLISKAKQIGKYKKKKCKSREIRGGENKQKHTIIYWMCNGFRAKEKRHFDLHKHAEEDEVYIGILNIVYSGTKSISIQSNNCASLLTILHTLVHACIPSFSALTPSTANSKFNNNNKLNGILSVNELTFRHCHWEWVR